jgi:hypothetical protein
LRGYSVFCAVYKRLRKRDGCCASYMSLARNSNPGKAAVPPSAHRITQEKLFRPPGKDRRSCRLRLTGLAQSTRCVTRSRCFTAYATAIGPPREIPRSANRKPAHTHAHAGPAWVLITVWSLLMATAHGAGLMVVPVFVRLFRPRLACGACVRLRLTWTFPRMPHSLPPPCTP